MRIFAGLARGIRTVKRLQVYSGATEEQVREILYRLGLREVRGRIVEGRDTHPLGVKLLGDDHGS